MLLPRCCLQRGAAFFCQNRRQKILRATYCFYMNPITAGILNILERFCTSRIESYAAALTHIRQHRFFHVLQQREDDIYIVTFQRSGTTWVQMICYQLLTDGNMGIDHIYDVSPWLSNAAVTGGDAAKINKLASPRIFKSHDSYGKFDPGVKGRFIHVHRNGEDVAVSLHHHIRNYRNPEQTLDQTLEEYFAPENDNNWFSFTQHWLKNANSFDILYIDYADLKNHFDPSVERIADFLNVALTEEVMQRVRERCSFSFMKKHESKFGEQPKNPRVYDQFIRQGKEGAGTELSAEQHLYFNKMHSQHIRNRQHRQGNGILQS